MSNYANIIRIPIASNQDEEAKFNFLEITHLLTLSMD